MGLLRAAAAAAAAAERRVIRGVERGVDLRLVNTLAQSSWNTKLDSLHS